MRVVKTTRLANPHGRKRTRRNMTPKQIEHFGTRRQKAALKAAKKRKRTMKQNSRRAAKVSRRVSRRAKRSSNPLVLHLKPLQRSNPQRRTKMAKPKRRRTMKNARRRVAHVNRRRRTSNPRRHNRRAVHNRSPRRHNRRRTNARRRNATRIVVMAPRRHNRRHHNRRSNPMLFGSSLGSKASLMILGGGLAGVAATKFIPTLIPSSITGSLGSSQFGPFILSGVSAIAAWWLASKVSIPFSEGVLFGGLMQTASVALNAFLPNLTIGGVPLALSGFGDLVPGQFAVPQNPLIQRRIAAAQAAQSAPTHAVAPTGSKVTTSGLGRAYPSAY
jgi:hypothetical protein